MHIIGPVESQSSVSLPKIWAVALCSEEFAAHEPSACTFVVRPCSPLLLPCPAFVRSPACDFGQTQILRTCSLWHPHFSLSVPLSLSPSPAVLRPILQWGWALWVRATSSLDLTPAARGGGPPGLGHSPLLPLLPLLSLEAAALIH